MNQQLDIKVIECNRQSSNELREDNVEVNSSWRNNLSDVVHLEAGDKVSVYSSFVNVDGAGNLNTMDIKGKSLGIKQTLYDTEITEPPDFIYQTPITNDYNMIGATKQEVLNRWRPNAVGEASTDPTGKEVELRDNEINMVISYYKNMDLDAYVQLPRRFVKNHDWYEDASFDSNGGWNEVAEDSLTEGRVLCNPWSCFMTTDYKYYFIDGNDGNKNMLKLRNNGDRYTLMIRNLSWWSGLNDGGANQPSTSFKVGGSNYAPDPENAYYYQYKEIKKLSIPAGFNSADYIANELTRQLQEITQNDTFSLAEPHTHKIFDDISREAPFTRRLNSETYKGFNAGTIFNYEEDNFNMIKSADEPSAGLTEDNARLRRDYYTNYQYVAMKRPDFYELGQRINRWNGIKGLTMEFEVFNSNPVITLDLEYNDYNLKLWKEFLEVEGTYPEFWYKENLATADTTESFYKTKNININNSRFIHMNRKTDEHYITARIPDGETLLGCSYYEDTTIYPFTENEDDLSSQVIFFHYDPSQKDKYYDNPDTSRNQFTYGFASKSTSGNIVINTEQLGGLPNLLFNGGAIEKERKLGFDFHWNSYGNTAIMLWTGKDLKNMSSSIDLNTVFAQTPSIEPDKPTPTTIPLADYSFSRYLNVRKINQCYIGADNCTIGYDGTHFFFSDFHTPKNVGTNSNAGSLEKIIITDVNHEGDAPNREDFTANPERVVYKMNVLDDYMDFSPTHYPYEKRKIYSLNDNQGHPSSFVKYKYQRPNTNQDYFSIFDSICGITIEDFGIPKSKWKESLWGLMGFTYEQFDKTNPNVRTQRIGSNNTPALNILTTNADVPIGDSKVYTQNTFGESAYNNQFAQPLTLDDRVNPTAPNGYPLYPTIQQATTSIKIVAGDFPTSMARSYYTIRSDIVGGNHFIGGKVENTLMPIVAVIDKMNPQGDFYFGTESSLQFTMTGKRVLSSVSVSIHDPDGSYANVGQYSSVLFKIERPRKLTYNIAQEIMLREEQEKKNKK